MRPITFRPNIDPHTAQDTPLVLTLDRGAAIRALTAIGHKTASGTADPRQVLDQITAALAADGAHIELYLLRRVAERCQAQGHALAWGPEPSSRGELRARLDRAQQHLANLTAHDASNAQMAAAHRAVADAHQALAEVCGTCGQAPDEWCPGCAACKCAGGCDPGCTGRPRNPFGPDQPAQRAAWPLATRRHPTA